MNNTELLDTIKQMVKPLNPPVQAFETSIRKTPFRILISVLLSSRTKDEVTHKASAQLFAKAETPQAMKELTEEDIAHCIYPVGFYKQKAKHIKTIATILSNTETGKEVVPQTMAELITLPGVGRKTANLVLALAFNVPAIAVDIHVFRISRRLGWAKSDKPEEVEQELMKLFPDTLWNTINQTLVGFGQTLCKPLHPLCSLCLITGACEFFKQNGLVEGKKTKKNND